MTTKVILQFKDEKDEQVYSFTSGVDYHEGMDCISFYEDIDLTSMMYVPLNTLRWWREVDIDDECYEDNGE